MNSLIFEVYGNLYGLKAAPKTWFNMICSVLLYLGYTQSLIDDCLFFIAGQIYLIIFVDDIFLTGTPKATKEFFRRLGKLFSLTIEMKNKVDFLGINITISKENIIINQVTSIQKHFVNFNVTEQRKPCLTKFSCSQDIELVPVEENITRLQKLVGTLSYLVKTRPDVAYHVNQLQTVAHIAHDYHISAAEYLLGYLHKTRTDGILFTRIRNRNLKLELFVDASQKINFSIGYIIYINDNVFSFKSKMIKKDSGSSCFAEALALDYGFKQLQFLLNILEDLKIFTSGKPIIYSDSQSLIQFLHKNGSTSNIKSWGLALHQVKQEIRSLCYFKHINGNENPADIFTKVLPVTKFNQLKRMMMFSEET